MKCPQCGAPELVEQFESDGGKHTRCPMCGAEFGRSGIKVEGTSYWQVLVVSAGLIVLLFMLAVTWKLIFG